MDLLTGALQNKTVWLNILGPVFAWLATRYGFNLTPDQQLAVVTVVMAVANFVMEHLTAGLAKPANPNLTRALLPFLVLAAALGLSACNASGTLSTGSYGAAAPSGQDPLGQIATFAVTDLQAAEAEATAQGDKIAAPCYTALITFVQDLQGQTGSLTAGTNVRGGFSGFQAARGLRLKVEGQVSGGLKALVPDYLKLGCSALVLDEQTFLLRLAALAGAGVATAGAAPAAGALLPALVPKLP